MIIGVTHGPDGRVIQRLSVSTKIAIGLPPNGDRNYPTKLDHFAFLRKKRTTKGVEWEPDRDLTGHYGKDCREIRIVLIDDDMDNIFPTSYAWWTAVERRCWGDGTSATRRTPEKPGGQPWTPCGSGCPELASGMCKPSGDLRFVLADFPRLGSVCRIHTSSYRSIRQIHSALQEIQSFTGNRLAGLTAKLVVRPEETAYFDANESRKKSTTIWALSLEVDGEDMQKLVSNLTENARVFAETRKLLGSARVIKVVEDEEEQAPELTAEFYSPASVAPSPREASGAAEAPNVTVNASNAPGTGAGSGRANGGRTSTGHPQGVFPPALPQGKTTTPPLREPQRKAAPTNGQESRLAKPASTASQQASTVALKSNGAAPIAGAEPKTAVVHGVIGPFEPDESGNTLRRNGSGVEYVVFKISQNGSAATVYCNRLEMLPEISRRQGREASAQVALVGNNGHSYYVLDRFVEG